MTSQATSPPSPSVSSPSPAPPLQDQEARRTSIAWTKLPEVPSAEQRRQTSLAFATGPSRSRSPAQASSSSSVRGGRSLSSPPPPPSFLKRVSFDTFDNKDASDFSLTLKSKHKDYSYSRRSRTFLCGTDQNDYSEFALEWLIEELVDDGDEIVCLRVVDKDSKISSDAGLQEGLYRMEARKLLNQIIDKNDEDKAISLILEFSVGKVHETIQRMIHIYEPVILIVGTRGRSLGGLQGLLPGSVSKYCLQHSPVPVIVVRPSSKRDKKKAKRKADPGRRIYQDILQQSESLSSLGNSRGAFSITEGQSNASRSSLGEGSSNSGNSDAISPNIATPNPEPDTEDAVPDTLCETVETNTPDVAETPREN